MNTRKFTTFIFICFFVLCKAQVLVKGPYLQIGTPGSVIIKWETNVSDDSKVEFGTNSASLTSSVTNTLLVTSHEMLLTGLQPYTKYFYTIGNISTVIQGDTNNYFLTSPLPGTAGNYRFWVTGDCGNGSTNQTNCKNQFLNYTGNRITNGWLTLGDNAYYTGADSEFNNLFFNYYQGDIMKKTVLWPAPGNHDYSNGTVTSPTTPYYDIFTTPSTAQAGGVASGTEAYYSFDYGNIHFISLDSYGTDNAAQKMYDTLGSQAVWLKSDLALNTKRWTIAYWHHPPYTMGNHNSDTEQDLVNIRGNFIRILERNNVDLILCGHSHDYERSKLMRGHYGNEASFNPALHNLDTSSAVDDGTTNACPYLKDSVSKAGTVYVLSGSAGQLGGQQPSFPHDAMYYSDAANGGSLILDIEDNKLECKWLCADGQIRDKFAIYKDVRRVKTFTVQPGQILNVAASWPSSTFWSNGATSRSLNAASLKDSVFYVNDAHNCIADTFKFRVLPLVNFSLSGNFCAGQSIQLSDLSSNNPVNWLWTVNPAIGTMFNSPGNQNPLLSITAPVVYTLSLLAGNAYGYGAVHSETVLIHATPSVIYTHADTLVCENSLATLSAGGASQYAWSTGQSDSVIQVMPSLSTVYTTTFVSSYGCMSIGALTVNVSACAEISEISKEGRFKVFPNPSSGEFTFELDEFGNSRLSIIDNTGKTVYKKDIREGEHKINLDLSPGIYFYSLETFNKYRASGKIIAE